MSDSQQLMNVYVGVRSKTSQGHELPSPQYFIGVLCGDDICFNRWDGSGRRSLVHEAWQSARKVGRFLSDRKVVQCRLINGRLIRPKTKEIVDCNRLDSEFVGRIMNSLVSAGCQVVQVRNQ
jgi:hypothetical protein